VIRDKLTIVLSLAMLLMCATARGGQGPDVPQKTGATGTQFICPDTQLLSIDSIDSNSVNNIESVGQGVRGLPCKARIEKNKPKNTSAREMVTTRLQDGFDYYSWLTFIALNSPADGVHPIGRDNGTFWETWKQLPDVMLPRGEKPAPWSNPNIPTPPAECAGKFKPGMMIIHMEMEETYNEPFKSGPLFDQNGNYAVFVIFLNQQMFQYIVDNSLYNIQGQRDFSGEINFPSGTRDDNTGNGTLGAVMVKASWKILKPGASENATFHAIDGLLYMPESAEPCRPVKLGLIGFHVGHKTDDRQQWIWTTFEHDRNVPSSQEADSRKAKGPYSFYNPDCLPDSCPVNETPPRPWEPDKQRPAWDPFLHPSTFKSQIVRMGPSPIFKDVGVLNTAFHESKWLQGTVWKNYDLITTQWPSDPCASDPHPGQLPDATCAPFPTFLANTTLETFSQQDKEAGTPLATSSCIACHNNATTHHQPATRSDFTYILEKAQGPVVKRQVQRSLK
jgi:hypothetical protein